MLNRRLTNNKADLILFNANILTLDSLRPKASFVAIKGDRILAVGDNLASFKVAATRLIDCQGKTVIPGFNDAHCHILAFVQSLLSMDFSPPNVMSIKKMQTILRKHVSEVAPDTWITATGYNEFYLAEKRHPTRWDLDAVAPHNPVRILHRSGHAQVLNSLALSRVGISIYTSEPPGALIDRDIENGEPNGLLFEMNNWVAEKIPHLSPAELEKWLTVANKQYLSLGITSLQDASVQNSPAHWQLFQTIKANGGLSPRLTMMLGYKHLDEFLNQELFPGLGDNQLRLGAVKIVLDESSGSLYPPQQELNNLVLRVHKAGYQVAIHAIDNVDTAAAALEYALSKYPKPHRHRIEHCSVCPPDTLNKLSTLGVIVVTQPPFLYYSGERYLSEVPKHQLPWLYRIKSFREAGLRPAASSDSPVVPNNPLMGIYAAVMRKTETGVPILPEEVISAQEALEMYTLAAAYATFEEYEKGTISPGKLADLVLLNNDPTTVPYEEIKNIKVEMTIIGGEVVWGGI